MQALSVFVRPGNSCFLWRRLTAFLDRVLYTPERLSAIASEAAKEGSVFTLDDRIGLLQDAMALSKAGFLQLSSTLTLIELWKNEKECVCFSLFVVDFVLTRCRSCLAGHWGSCGIAGVHLVGTSGDCREIKCIPSGKSFLSVFLLRHGAARVQFTRGAELLMDFPRNSLSHWLTDWGTNIMKESPATLPCSVPWPWNRLRTVEMRGKLPRHLTRKNDSDASDKQSGQGTERPIQGVRQDRR